MSRSAVRGTAAEDPYLERLKGRWRRRGLPRPGLLHVISIAGVIGGAATVTVGTLQPWLTIDGVAEVPLLTGGQDGAMAGFLVAVAAVQVLLALTVLWRLARHRIAGSLHGLALPLSLIGGLAFRSRIAGDEHQLVLLRATSQFSDTGLARGVGLTAVGLCIAGLAPLLAIPTVLRRMRV